MDRMNETAKWEQRGETGFSGVNIQLLSITLFHGRFRLYEPYLMYKVPWNRRLTLRNQLTWAIFVINSFERSSIAINTALNRGAQGVEVPYVGDAVGLNFQGTLKGFPAEN